MQAVLFYILAALALSSAMAAVSRRDPAASAICLLGVALPIAAIVAMMGSSLLSAILIAAATATSSLAALFVAAMIMPSRRSKPGLVRFGKVLAAAGGLYLAIVMAIAVAAPPFSTAPASGEYFESPLTTGSAMVSGYALPLELAGVMVLIAAAAATLIWGRGEAR